MGEIRFSGRSIGSNRPCFVIAEAGVNHNGDIEIAKQLIDAVHASGADAVKFQTWITDKLVVPDAIMAEYQKENVGKGQSQFDMLKQLELNFDQFRELKRYADQLGILFLSTPDEEDSANFLEELGVPVFKIGSGEVSNLPYLRYIAAKGRPIILSTGMSTLGEVEAAVRAIEQAGNTQLALLHSVSDYPANPSDCNLRAIDTLVAAFGYPVGFSDHTLGVDVAIAAVARGACIVEKHFTLDRNMPGPDHRASLEPVEFTRMVKGIRTVESALGDGIKRPVASEIATKRVVQKSLVTARAIAIGQQITEADIVLRRTSGGMPPAYLPFIVGKRAKQALRANETLVPDMVQ